MHPDEWNKSTFAVFFAAVIFGAIISAGIINYVVDPYDLYGVDLFAPIEVNQYAAKLDMFRAYEPPPSALILGNSRVKAFDPNVVENYTGTKCYNWGLGFASTEVLLAELKIALDEEHAPIEMIVLGIDPIMFNTKVAIPKQARVEPGYTRYFAPRPVLTANWERMSHLFTMDQLKMSFVAIWRKMSGGERLIEPEYRADGLTVFAIRHMNDVHGPPDLDEIVTEGAPKYFQNTLAGWTELAPERKKAWIEFLGLCVQHNIKIYAFMTPMHPLLWGLLGEYGSQDIFLQSYDYCERTITEAGGTFRNYSDIATWGGDPNLFNDEVHMLPKNCAVLMKVLFTSAGLEPIEEVSQ
jgi:hypothetical protein